MDDWKKKLQVLKANQPSQDFYKAARSLATIRGVFRHSIEPTIQRILEELIDFEDQFTGKKLWLGNGDGEISADTLGDIQRNFDNNCSMFQQQIIFKYELKGYQKSLIRPFDVNCQISWKLEEYCYFISQLGHECTKYSQLYDQFYSREEIEEIVNQCGNYIMEQLEYQLTAN